MARINEGELVCRYDVAGDDQEGDVLHLCDVCAGRFHPEGVLIEIPNQEYEVLHCEICMYHPEIDPDIEKGIDRS